MQKSSSSMRLCRGIASRWQHHCESRDHISHVDRAQNEPIEWKFRCPNVFICSSEAMRDAIPNRSDPVGAPHTCEETQDGVSRAPAQAITK